MSRRGSSCTTISHGLSLVHEGHGARSGRVISFELSQPEASATNERVDLSVQVTTTRETAPQGRQSILPERNVGIGRQPVFDKSHLPTGPKDSASLHERLSDINDAA